MTDVNYPITKAEGHHFWLKDADLRHLVSATLFTDLPGDAVKLYLKLLSYGNPNKLPYVYPKHADLLDHLGISLKTLKKAIIALKEAGLIGYAPGKGHSNSEFYFKEPQNLRPFKTKKQTQTEALTVIKKVEKEGEENLTFPPTSTNSSTISPLYFRKNEGGMAMTATQVSANSGLPSLQRNRKDISAQDEIKRKYSSQNSEGNSLSMRTDAPSATPSLLQPMQSEQVIPDLSQLLAPAKMSVFSLVTPSQKNHPVNKSGQRMQQLTGQTMSNLTTPIINNNIIQHNQIQQHKRAQGQPMLRISTSPENKLVGVREAFVKEAVVHGMSYSLCEKMLNNFPKTEIELKAILGELHRQKYAVKNKAGWLRCALMGDYDLSRAIDEIKLADRRNRRLKTQHLNHDGKMIECWELATEIEKKEKEKTKAELDKVHGDYLNQKKAELGEDFAKAEQVAQQRCFQKGYDESSELYEGFYNFYLREELKKMVIEKSLG